MPKPGLTGRSGRVLVTMDAPTWYDRLTNRASGRSQVARATLKFCGVKPVRTMAFGSVGKRTDAQREAMLAKARKAGMKDGRRVVAQFAIEPKALLA